MAGVKGWFAIAARPDVVNRSLRVAVVVGTILGLINNWDRLIPYTLDVTAWVKIGLTYCVPFCVSTYASVGAILARAD